METINNTTKWAKSADVTVANEIDALQERGIDLQNIKVNVTENGEWCWGDPVALEKSEMEQLMNDCGMSSYGMITGYDYYIKHKRPSLSTLKREYKQRKYCANKTQKEHSELVKYIMGELLRDDA
jgi:hypothetical protein